MHAEPTPLTASRSGPLKGRVRVPGDKSISHRALILGALAVGETRISGLLEGEDVLNTAKAVQALGAQVERSGAGEWRLRGVGVGGFAAPAQNLDFGNSGTGCRLMLGAVAGCPITATFDGDASLRRRPMRRVLDPLERIGARTLAATDGVSGSGMSMASASAVSPSPKVPSISAIQGPAAGSCSAPSPAARLPRCSTATPRCVGGRCGGCSSRWNGSARVRWLLRTAACR